jgi:hypothetical protein
VLHGWGDKALTAWADKADGAAVGYHALQSAGHAVVGGGLSELTGGNFKDGFIGAGFAALLSPVGRGINRRLKLGEPGTGNSWQYLGRTATAATIGGTVTAISGGKFGNGAATAAFLHVVNHEVMRWAEGVRAEAYARDERLKRAFLVNRKADDFGDPTEYSSGETMWSSAQNSFPGARYYDISDPNWSTEYLAHVERWGQFDLVGIRDHGTPGDQWFGGPTELEPGSANWLTVTSGVKAGGAVCLFGCKVAAGKGWRYVASLALDVSSRRIAVFAGSTSFRSRLGQFEAPGVQYFYQYRGMSVLYHSKLEFKTQVD